MRRIAWLCVAGLLCFPLAAISAPAKVATEVVATAGEVRSRLESFEQAWNRGDVEALVSQYDRSLNAILGVDYLAYDAYVRQVRTLMAAADRPHMKLELHEVRSFAPDLVLANGRVRTRARDGTEQVGMFTVIYLKRDGQWKFVYVHS